MILDASQVIEVGEFWGLTPADSYAPLILVNGKDRNAVQTLTPIHELCHLALSEAGVSKPLDEPCVKDG